MLIGVGGSGKQSLSKLAAFICGFEVRQLSVTSKFKVWYGNAKDFELLPADACRRRQPGRVTLIPIFYGCVVLSNGIFG